MSTSSRWIPALAGYRAVAALAVYVFHVVSVDPPGGVIGRWTVPLGNAAVAVFFVLSGFLIFRPFVAWAAGHAEPISTWRFIVRRAARILPVYWVILTVHLFVFAPGQASGIGDYLTVYGLAQNFRGALVFLPPFVAWSLCIELWFSVVLPFVAAPLRRLADGRSLDGVLRVHYVGVGLLMVFGLVFRMWALTSPVESGRILWMPAYLDWFGFGLLLAIASTRWVVRGPGPTARALANNAWLLAVIGLAAYWAVTQLGLPGGFTAPTNFQTHSQFILEGLMSGVLVWAAVLPGAQLGTFGRVLSSRLFGWLGAISYGIYLAHPVITDAMHEAAPDLTRWVIGPVALLLTMFVAAVLRRYVEVPAAAAIDRWLGTGRSDRLSTPGPSASAPVVSEEGHRVDPRAIPIAVGTRAGNSMLIVASLLATTFSLPGRYVADARFELFADPWSRLDRMLRIWDDGRDLGRPAEEFWPGITAAAALFDRAGAPLWLNQRLIHALLLALAATGAAGLSRRMRPDSPWTAVITGVLYAFGPFSAIYLVPSPLYTAHALAPWAVVAVLDARRGRHALRWAGVMALALFAIGNADPPGLLYGLVPAFITWVVAAFDRTTVRSALGAFTLTTAGAGGLVSAAMLFKTGAGADALAQRLRETESVAAVAANSSFLEVFRGSGFWLSYFELGSIRFRTQQLIFLEDGWLVLATLIPLVLIAVGVARRPSGAGLLAVAWVLIGAAIAVGPYPLDDPSPYGRWLLDVYGEHELAFAFRSTHKAGVIVALGLAVGAGSTLADIAAWRPRPDGRVASSRGLGLVFVASLMLLLTQPFWRTPLYDPELTTDGRPSHWIEVADHLEQNPPLGRVLVLPGSTNNGYTWGSVGDDVLDTQIPNRLAASTLPLSTPLAADIVAELDALATSPDYTPGTFGPLARRLGITHVLIRNDLDWALQGLAPPTTLDPLRDDPDLTLISGFGKPGNAVATASGDPSSLPPLELYALGGAGDAGSFRLPASDSPRRILVDGGPSGLEDLARAGLLLGDHVVRFASDVSDWESELADTALIVVTDSNQPLRRQINYHGFDVVPASEDEPASPWLPGFDPTAFAVESLDGATVRSTVDRWAQGLDGRSILAVDSDPETAWWVPLLLDPAEAEWSIDFERTRSIREIEIDVADPGDRVAALQVGWNGRQSLVPVNDGRAVVSGDGDLSTLTIRFADTSDWPTAVGLSELRFDGDGPSVVVSMSSTVASRLSTLDLAIDEVPVAYLMRRERAGDQRLVREFETHRPDEMVVSATVRTEATSVRCLRNALQIDDVAVPLRITPIGDGLARLGLCRDREVVELESGAHRLVLDVPADVDVDRLMLVSAGASLEPVERLPVEGLDAKLEPGDILVLDAAFDADWQLDGSSEPFSADGLTAFVVTSEAAGVEPVYLAEAGYRIALLVTAVGLWVGIALVLLGARLWSPRPRNAPASIGRRITDGISGLVAAASAIALAWFVGSGIGLAAAAAAIISGLGTERLARRIDRRISIFWLVALAAAVLAIVTAWPQFPSDSGRIDPRRMHAWGVALEGASLGALAVAWIALRSSQRD